MTRRTRIARRLRSIADRLDPDNARPAIYSFGQADEPGTYWLGPDGARKPSPAELGVDVFT